MENNSYKLIFLTLFLILSINLVYGGEFGYNNKSLPQLIEDLFDGKPSSFYMPNNKSVFGNFSFNGGFLNGGCTIRDGAILCQEGFFVNISSLNITQQNLTIINNLTVDGNVSADFFLGDGSQLTGIIGTSPAGSDTQVQFNDGGGFGGNSGFIFNKSTTRVGIGTSTPQNTLNVVGDLNVTDNFIIGGNITLPNGGVIFDNSTCTFITSPNGLSRLEVCDP